MTIAARSVSVLSRGKRLLDVPELVIDRRPTLLLGVNGAGKSTLLKVLSGSGLCRSGEVVRTGRVAFVEQLFRPIYGFTALEYCIYVAWLKGQRRATAQREASQWLSFVGLDAEASQRCETLSGGQKARLAIATAMNSGADTLILDEPGASLDVIAKEELLSIYARIADSGQGLLVSTHDGGELGSPFERVIVLDKGQLAFDGTPQGFLRLATSDSSEVAHLARAFAHGRGSR